MTAATAQLGQRIWLRDLSPAEREEWQRRLTVPDTAAERSALYSPAWRKRHPAEPPVVRLWSEDGDTLLVPYGRVDSVPACQYDNTDTGPWLNPEEAPEVRLRDYQAAAVEAMLAHRCGVLVAPTGSGKTAMMAALIAARRCRTIVLTHTRLLARQTQAALASLLERNVALIGDGTSDRSDVTVALVQAMPPSTLRAMGPWGMMLLDEVHHGAAPTWRAIVDGVNARWRYGLTATPERADGGHRITELVLGPVRYTVTRDAVGAHLVPVDVEPRLTHCRYPDCATDPTDPQAWRRLQDAIAADVARNEIIADMVEGEPLESRMLVLTDRIAHARALADLLPRRQPALLVGDLSMPARRAAMARAAQGCPLTIGTLHLLGEGIDIPGWDTLLMASPIASRGPRLAQMVGRIARPAPGKTTGVVVDLLDDHPMLMAAWRGRRARYRVLGARLIGEPQ